MNSNSSGIPGLSGEQWNSLLTLLNHHATFHKLFGKTKITWILDSTYSHHMTSRRELLKYLQAVGPYIISLPNGAEAVASE